MQQVTSGRHGSARRLLSLAAILAVGPSAWAYINGGDYHSTRWAFEQQLRREHWAVSGGDPLPRDWAATKRIASEVKADRPDNAELRHYASQLVGRALKALPQKEADGIPLAAKREIARITCEALHQVIAKGGPSVKEGRTGPLKYKVGLYSFETWWETNYRGGAEKGRRIHARSTWWVPFVALKVGKAEGEEKR